MTKQTTQTLLEQFQEHVRHLPRKPTPIIKCAVCGLEVVRKYWKQKTCSRSCNGKLPHINRQINNL